MASAQGRREVHVDELWVSYGVTARADNEMAVELRLRRPRDCFGIQAPDQVHEDLARS